MEKYNTYYFQPYLVKNLPPCSECRPLATKYLFYMIYHHFQTQAPVRTSGLNVVHCSTQASVSTEHKVRFLWSITVNIRSVIMFVKWWYRCIMKQFVHIFWKLNIYASIMQRNQVPLVCWWNIIHCKRKASNMIQIIPQSENLLFAFFVSCPCPVSVGQSPADLQAGCELTICLEHRGIRCTAAGVN